MKPEFQALVCWQEFQPFVDKIALKSSAKLKLGDDAKTLAKRVEPWDFPRLVAALVRAQLAKDHEQIIEQASAA